MFHDRFPPLRGALALTVIRPGRGYAAVRDNLVLTEARRLVPQLLGGVVSAPAIGIGLGTNPATPIVGDTALQDVFRKPIAAIEVNDTSITFRFVIELGEALGMNVREYGLYADDRLIARTVRSLITKTPDLKLAGAWTLQI